ncbi:oleoyl-acyl carrier protein thioesterase, chloroplastic-like [Eucalyptus grandis]|uniref:oleoyl-acyl carrier protein thioesterase, chloroplastic-like n=1 Tax=Eucalyptus grandis TaxID=71139 RepID=UPI00192EFDF2|nr:oleoyl-acyl carrier protein thioesterase, chloroplastic-like [Eucalyptus grandis]
MPGLSAMDSFSTPRPWSHRHIDVQARKAPPIPPSPRIHHLHLQETCRFGNQQKPLCITRARSRHVEVLLERHGPCQSPGPMKILDTPKPGLLPSGRRAAATAIISCYPASKALTLAVVCNGSARVEPRSSSLANRLRLGSLTEDGLSYKESFMVRCYEVGINKTATVETMANLLQEAACNHIQSLGFSTDGFATTSTMRKMNLIWVTARMHIEIYKYPAGSDVVEIETWLHGEGRIGTRRDWILKDYANGQVIGRATSKWVMMNQETRRLQKVNDDVRDEYLIFSPRESSMQFNISIFDEGAYKGPFALLK